MHLLAFPLQQGVPLLQPLYACAPPPKISLFLQRLYKTPLLPSTVRYYIALNSDWLLWKCVPLCQPSDEPASLPQL